MNFQFLQKNVVNANAKPSKQLKEKLPNVIVDMKMLNTKVVLILRAESCAMCFGQNTFGAKSCISEY